MNSAGKYPDATGHSLGENLVMCFGYCQGETAGFSGGNCQMSIYRAILVEVISYKSGTGKTNHLNDGN